MTSNSAAIVVLGARVHPDGRPSSALTRRIERAAQAWHQGLSPVVLCSGGQSWNGHVEALVMRDALLRLEVPARAAWVETDSLSTAENARASSRILRREGIGHALVVSCPWHLPRAVADFLLCDMAASPLPASPAPAPPTQRAWRHLVERGCALIDRGRLTFGDLR
ncbi:MAG TPA: YdcF family protein [Polyangiaceae bacterium]|nr:YdcF family protein [Polyangiaceae bacterium]